VPAVLDCRDGLLVLEYLPGDPLPDIIERGGYDAAALAEALCAWFMAFYAAVPSGESRGDVNGRNFLCHFGSDDGAKIYSVDFESRCYAPPSRDAGRLAAFLETYDTRDPESQTALAEAFMRNFAEKFNCTLNDILAQRQTEYAAMRQRRAFGRRAEHIKPASPP